MILVTAVLGHVMTISGCPKRVNPILGKVISFQSKKLVLDKQGLTFTTLGRQNLTNIDTEGRGFHQEALTPLNAETHSGEDVALYARGPGADFAVRTIEQNVIFHMMDYAADLRSRAMQNNLKFNVK